MKYFILILLVLAGISYYAFFIIESKEPDAAAVTTAAGIADTLPQTRDSLQKGNQNLIKWNKEIPLNAIVSFAETLKGIPYLYASSDPSKGFDCSGFITYVFNHFGLDVPRSSVEFTDKGITVPVEEAKRGDLILFTGTDSSSAVVGHMGIVTENSDSLRFIHSSSGKANGVTVTALNDHYQARFVKVIAIEKGL